MSETGQDRWTPEDVVAAIQFDDNGEWTATPEVTAHIEHRFGVTVEEFVDGAMEWFLARRHELPSTN